MTNFCGDHSITDSKDHTNDKKALFFNNWLKSIKVPRSFERTPRLCLNCMAKIAYHQVLN